MQNNRFGQRCAFVMLGGFTVAAALGTAGCSQISAMMPDPDAKVRAQLAALFQSPPAAPDTASPAPAAPAPAIVPAAASPTPAAAQQPAPAVAAQASAAPANRGIALSVTAQADPFAKLRNDLAGNPSDVALRVNYATALANAGRNTDALDVLHAADDAARNDNSLLLLRGQLELRLQYGEQASITYRQILSVDPQSVEALNGLGIANVTLGMPATAEESFRRAVAAAPTDIRSVNNLGLSLALQAKTKDAIALLRPLLKQDSGNVGVRRNLALAYTIAHDRKSAVAVLTPVMSVSDANAAINAFALQEVYPRYHPAAAVAAKKPAIQGAKPTS